MVTGRFRVDAELASGGFATVYAVTELASGEHAALKMLHVELTRDPRECARFRREAATLGSLHSAHVVGFHELGETASGRLFIVMELLRGETLLDRMLATGPMPWRLALEIARGVCGALDEAHALGIVHRDLKPANIYLEDRAGAPAFVKLLDFGAAKILYGAFVDDGAELTQAGVALGTLEYMAPEQRIAAPSDPRTDIYALGVIVYESITGVRPQAAYTAASPAFPIDTPVEVRQLVLRCLERDPRQRFSNIQELASTIEHALAPRRLARGSECRFWLAPDRVATATFVGEPPWLDAPPVPSVAEPGANGESSSSTAPRRSPQR